MIPAMKTNRPALSVWQVVALACLTALFASGPGCGKSGGDTTASSEGTPGGGLVVRPPVRVVMHMNVSGMDRSYILRLPAGYDGQKKLPLVMLLHGASDSAAYAEQAYGFAEKADKEDIILVLPDAIGDRHAWDSIGTKADEGDGDMEFLKKVLDEVTKPSSAPAAASTGPATTSASRNAGILPAPPNAGTATAPGVAGMPPAQLPDTAPRYAVDTTRLYVAGHSAGAIMAYQLAAAMPERFAAVGIVAGTVGWHGDDDVMHTIPRPKVGISVIAFHGKQDTNIVFEPDLGLGKNDYYTIGARESAAWWAETDHCGMRPVITALANGAVERRLYVNIEKNLDVVLYSLRDGNHMWPGGKEMPGKTEKPIQVISATDLMWDFFKAHSRNEGP